jgi:FkbM family methyltransferase
LELSSKFILNAKAELQRLFHSSAMIRAFKVLAILLGLSLCLEVAVFLYPPLYILGLALIGHSRLCSPGQAFQGAVRYQHFRKDDRITKRSHLVETDRAGFHLWETPRGRYWIPKGSDDVLLILLSQQESRIYGFDEQTSVHTGDIVVDCGAHIGVYTREALSLGAKLVVAIEPAPENLECLRRNFAPEIAAGRVIVYPKGVWDKEDVLTLYTYPGNSAADGFVIFNQAIAEGKQQIAVTTIDNIVRELNLKRVDFIKMDIKGSVLRALSGAQTTLREHKPHLAISTEEEPEGSEQIAAHILGLPIGYRMRCGTCAANNQGVTPNELFFF